MLRACIQLIVLEKQKAVFPGEGQGCVQTMCDVGAHAWAGNGTVILCHVP